MEQGIVIEGLKDACIRRKKLTTEKKKQFSEFNYENQMSAIEITKILIQLIKSSNESSEFFDWFRISKYDTQAKVVTQSLYLRREKSVVMRKTHFANVNNAKKCFSENTMRALETYLNETGLFKVVIAQEENSPYWECWIQLL